MCNPLRIAMLSRFQAYPCVELTCNALNAHHSVYIKIRRKRAFGLSDFRKITKRSFTRFIDKVSSLATALPMLFLEQKKLLDPGRCKAKHINVFWGDYYIMSLGKVQKISTQINRNKIGLLKTKTRSNERRDAQDHDKGKRRIDWFYFREWIKGMEILADPIFKPWLNIFRTRLLWLSLAFCSVLHADFCSIEFQYNFFVVDVFIDPICCRNSQSFLKVMAKSFVGSAVKIVINSSQWKWFSFFAVIESSKNCQSIRKEKDGKQKTRVFWREMVYRFFCVQAYQFPDFFSSISLSLSWWISISFWWHFRLVRKPHTNLFAAKILLIASV